MYKKNLIIIILIAAMALFYSPAPADLLTDYSPYAVGVAGFTSGANAVAGYNNPAAALGEPTRFIPGDYGGDVTFFNAPWKTDQIVSIGAGGELIVKFDHQVRDDSLNPYGLDFIIFSNTFFYDADYPNGRAGGVASEPAQIAVSQDNQTWYDIAGAYADDLFPTCGFTDSSGPFASDGSTPADFTKPVNPGLDWQGKTFTQLNILYAGSGGGGGVDISSTGLDWIQYVKVYQDPADQWSAEIDAFADVAPVPEPTTALLFTAAALILLRRKKITKTHLDKSVQIRVIRG